MEFFAYTLDGALRGTGVVTDARDTCPYIAVGVGVVAVGEEYDFLAVVEAVGVEDALHVPDAHADLRFLDLHDPLSYAVRTGRGERCHPCWVQTVVPSWVR